MSSSLRTGLIWGSVILGIVLLMAGLIKLGTRPATGNNSVLAAEVTATDHSKGADNASITLVEYSDFQCPACATYAPVIKRLLEENPNDFRVIYRHYPLVEIHENALLASYAAEAADRQGKFWEMHDVLFNTQKQWSERGDANEFFIKLALSLGLNEEQFKTDMNSKEVKERVKQDRDSGQASGVRGTPSLFLNGKGITPASYADIQTAIDALRNQP